MAKRIGYRHIWIVVFFLFVFAPTLCAQNAEIRDLRVLSSPNQLLVHARVTNCFTKDIEAAILAGVPTTFTFLLDLYQVRTSWWDKKLSRTTVQHTIKYDNVKKLFLVSADGEKEATAFPDFEVAKRAMANLNGVPLLQPKAWEKNESYYVMVKAKLDKIRLPLRLEVVFFFVSLWDFETDWYREGVSF